MRKNPNYVRPRKEVQAKAVAEHNKAFEKSLKKAVPFIHAEVRRSKFPGIPMKDRGHAPQRPDTGFQRYTGNMRRYIMTLERHNRLFMWKKRMNIHRLRFNS